MAFFHQPTVSFSYEATGERVGAADAGQNEQSRF
jgi:hypothetical protein